jgi:glycolate oxidase
MVCVLPKTAEQISAVLAYAQKENIRIVPRGAGTSLSGGALPLADGNTARPLTDEPDSRDRLREPVRGGAAGGDQRVGDAGGREGGVLLCARSLEPDRVHHRRQCGGEFGGIHCLKYGLTTQNLMGVELVLVSGERLRLGGKQAGDGRLDLLSVVAGSEGLSGVVTEATLRILPRAPATRRC